MTLISPGQTAQLVVGDPTAKALSVVVDWQDDRFVHRIEVVVSGEHHELMRCQCSGPEDAAWPKTAPLQQLSQEVVDGRSVLLGVGQAGTSHWSISMEAADDEDPTLRMDCACRVSERPEFLGCRYEWDEATECNTDAFAGILFQCSGETMQFAPDDAQTRATSSTDERWLETRPGSLDVDLPSTVRWSYRICLM